ncbi:MAG: cryptochrome/photolyase family protein [Planctomycetales bacterium]|nr:cryptochrome/photolyase family protein [bacterium]UNM09706.1 MAG: cryptochrome/photolyase family protein [Planctomycetales bacterium]
MSCLRLVLGDQLSHSLPSLSSVDRQRDVVLLCEVIEEATYVRHHRKKIAFIFSAMRHFADELRAEGYRVDYIRLDDPANSGSLGGELRRAIKRHGPGRVELTQPGEYRVLQEMLQWQRELGLPVEILADSRFVCSLDEFADWASGRKQLRMEFFYREMRRKLGILMDGGQPLGGRWNFDSENRRPPASGLLIPQPHMVEPDDITREVLALVASRFPDNFGDLEPFHFAVTRRDALEALELFITERLAEFGDYQDAMLSGQPWMYHSHISMYLNCGLLEPLECVEAAEQAYREGLAPLNAVEGFIRQLIGWREFVRGIYWLRMPQYRELNALNATRRLPWFYWDGNTEMNCLRQCVTETRQHAYAHHIQRLMVLGNFALLAGIHPHDVNEWFLVVYADAYEWVELPNVTGMSQFADGGFLGSKPYASSGSYIKRMSDYCRSCRYDVKQRTGEDACPFNYLYWDFLERHRSLLSANPRMAMMYRTWDRMDEAERVDILALARSFLDALE